MKKWNPCLFLLLAAAGCGDSSHHGGQFMPDQDLQHAMAAVGTKRIYFGHQSVGANILTGLKDIYATSTGPHLSVVTAAEAPLPPGGVFAESRIGKNTDPESKCRAFTSAVERLQRDSIDIAMMKFCYVDFNAKTDVQKTFNLYCETVEKLRKESPSLTIVHVTAPLTVRTAWWKKIAKRVLGRAENSDAENVMREEFNALLREKFSGEPVFDLASTESTYPDGTRNSFAADGKTAYALVPAFSSDGSHLNPEGARTAAAALVRTLATAAERRPR